MDGHFGWQFFKTKTKSKLARDMEHILRHSQFSEEPTENSQETNAERWLGKPSIHHI